MAETLHIIQAAREGMPALIALKRDLANIPAFKFNDRPEGEDDIVFDYLGRVRDGAQARL